jgi:hypothetical protein
LGAEDLVVAFNHASAEVGGIAGTDAPDLLLQSVFVGDGLLRRQYGNLVIVLDDGKPIFLPKLAHYEFKGFFDIVELGAMHGAAFVNDHGYVEGDSAGSGFVVLAIDLKVKVEFAGSGSGIGAGQVVVVFGNADEFKYWFLHVEIDV